MPKVSLFRTHLRLVIDYVESLGEKYNDPYIIPGDQFTMNYTQTRNYTSQDATIPVTVVSVDMEITDDWPQVSIVGLVLKPAEPIYVCEWGAYLARGITLHNETTTIGSGAVNRILES